MEKINININQAKLLQYTVELKDDKPEISASIGLFAGQKQISTFSLSTYSYYSGIQFNIPPNIIKPIMDIAFKLQAITIGECSKALAELPAPSEGIC